MVSFTKEKKTNEYGPLGGRNHSLFLKASTTCAVLIMEQL